MLELIEVKDLRKIYGSGDAAVAALNGVTLELKKGEFVSIIGPSGSGKTTLLSCLGGILRPTGGTITAAGAKIDGFNNAELARYRRDRIGFVFQSFNLVPSLTALENVAIALRIAGKSRSESLKKARDLLKTVGLENRSAHFPAELSGGEKQRVSIARALANNPEVILADEPTANLDTESARRIIRLLETLTRSQGKAVVVVTHDERMIDHVDKVYRLTDGRLAAVE